MLQVQSEKIDYSAKEIADIVYKFSERVNDVSANKHNYGDFKVRQIYQP